MDDNDFPIDIEEEIMEFLHEDLNVPQNKLTLDEYFTVEKVQQLTQNSKLLTLKSSYKDGGEKIELILKGKWAQNEIDPHDNLYVNCQTYNETLKVFELNDDNLSFLKKDILIVEPEMMLGSTLIKYSFPCKRRAILSEIFKIVNKQSKITVELLVGIVVHELFEFIVLKGVSDLKRINQMIDEILNRYNVEISLLKMSFQECRKMIAEFVDQIIKFFNQYFVSK